MSLDRLDNVLGYVRGNVVWASRFANCGRGEMNVEQFQGFLKILRTELTRDQLPQGLLPKTEVEKTI